MAMVTALGPDAGQVDYRLQLQCGGEDIAADDVALTYRLAVVDGARPIERTGSGWVAFEHEAGTVLSHTDDVTGVREIMGGRDPATGRQLVSPKYVTARAAKLAARPLVAAIAAAAEQAGVRPEQLVGGDRVAAKRLGRLQRGVSREGGSHEAPVGDLARVARAAGLDLAQVYDAQALSHAQHHADEKVRVGNRGYDLTLDIAKSESLLYGLSDPAMAARIEELYLESVRETVTAMEQWAGYALSGHHGQGQSAQRVDTSGLIGTITLHRSARPVDGQTGDPHLHAHVMLANMVKCEDGTWRTVAAGGRDLYRHTPAGGQYLRARMRDKLQAEYGLAYERDPESGRWEIAGIDRTTRTVFSRRTQQVLDKAGAGASAAQQRTTARATVEAKDSDADPAGERAAWRARARANGLDPQSVVAAAGVSGLQRSRDTQREHEGDGAEIDVQALAAAVFDPETGVTSGRKDPTRAQILAAVADAAPALAGLDELETLTDQVLESEHAVALPPSGQGHMSNAARYTSADVLEAEQTLTDQAQQRMRAGAARIDVSAAARRLAAYEHTRGITLSDEQRAALSRLVCGGHGIDALVGVAGSGKTTIMHAARTVWEQAGYRVAGAATAAVAADNLRAEAAIPSRTIAAWKQRLDQGGQRPALSGVDVLVVDEAAMVDDRSLARLASAAEASGTKLVGIGDPQQLRAIGVGGGFKRIHELTGGHTLSENRRQKTDVDQQALAAWRSGQHEQALQEWAAAGRVHTPDTAEDARSEIVAAWQRDRAQCRDAQQSVDSLLVLATRREDVEQLNTELRAVARQDGYLSGPDATITQLDGTQLSLAVGDQVRITTNDYRASRGEDGVDIYNGTRAVVKHLSRSGVRINWHTPEGPHSAEIAADQLAAGMLTHAYAATIASAQGQTTARARVYGTEADGHTLYPAMSRAKNRSDLYLARTEIESEEDQRRHGPPVDAQEAQRRTISAYVPQLGEGDDGMVTDETQPQHQEPDGQADTARPGLLSVEEAKAGRGPQAQQASPVVARHQAEQQAQAQRAEQLRRQLAEVQEQATQSRWQMWRAGTNPRQLAAQRHQLRHQLAEAHQAQQREQEQARTTHRRAVEADTRTAAAHSPYTQGARQQLATAADAQAAVRTALAPSRDHERAMEAAHASAGREARVSEQPHHQVRHIRDQRQAEEVSRRRDEERKAPQRQADERAHDAQAPTREHDGPELGL